MFMVMFCAGGSGFVGGCETILCVVVFLTDFGLLGNNASNRLHNSCSVTMSRIMMIIRATRVDISKTASSNEIEGNKVDNGL